MTTATLGAGLQGGVEVTALVLVINSQRALDSFIFGGNVALGTQISVANGPMAAQNVPISVGPNAPVAMYSYAKSKGV